MLSELDFSRRLLGTTIKRRYFLGIPLIVIGGIIASQITKGESINCNELIGEIAKNITKDLRNGNLFRQVPQQEVVSLVAAINYPKDPESVALRREYLVIGTSRLLNGDRKITKEELSRRTYIALQINNHVDIDSAKYDALSPAEKAIYATSIVNYSNLIPCSRAY